MNLPSCRYIRATHRIMRKILLQNTKRNAWPMDCKDWCPAVRIQMGWNGKRLEQGISSRNFQPSDIDVWCIISNVCSGKCLFLWLVLYALHIETIFRKLGLHFIGCWPCSVHHDLQWACNLRQQQYELWLRAPGDCTHVLRGGWTKSIEQPPLLKAEELH